MKPLRTLNTILFFAFRTGEELTAKDLDVKLGVPARNVPTLLNRSCRDGLLAKSTKEDGRVIYKAGPRLIAMVKGMERWL